MLKGGDGWDQKPELEQMLDVLQEFDFEAFHQKVIKDAYASMEDTDKMNLNIFLLQLSSSLSVKATLENRMKAVSHASGD